MRSTANFYNDGSKDAPKLRVFLNLETIHDLRKDSVLTELETVPLFERLAADGFEGVQLTTDALAPSAALLPYCGLDRINTPAEAEIVAAKHAARGDLCITVHAGWGMEDDDDVSRLVEAILAASNKYSLPIFLETHRATITQDMWRTVQIAKKFPELRFNGDFSHYYCGQEMVNGNWAEKLAFMEPIFARIGFMHGRIASPGCIQVPIDSDLAARPAQAHGAVDYLTHFKEMWTKAMHGFLRAAGEGDVLIFAPELLSKTYYYARMFPDGSGGLAEESDRYAQALLLKDLARACLAEAKRL